MPSSADIDLAAELNDATIDSLRRALLKHHVLFFENQTLEPKTQRALAGAFRQAPHPPDLSACRGRARDHRARHSHNNLPDNDNWHTDVTFIETPPLGAILAAKTIPPSGGDTSWASTIAAYEALSEPVPEIPRWSDGRP